MNQINTAWRNSSRNRAISMNRLSLLQRASVNVCAATLRGGPCYYDQPNQLVVGNEDSPEKEKQTFDFMFSK